MRCAKCQRKPATFHFTPVRHGKAQNPVHLCIDCTSASTGFHLAAPTQPEAWLLTGKKRCSFCGRPARVGNTLTGTTRYWCLDCTCALRKIFLSICASERPQLPVVVDGTVTSIARDLVLARHSAVVDQKTATFVVRDAPEVAAWMEAAYLRATKILIDRRRQSTAWRRCAARMPHFWH